VLQDVEVNDSGRRMRRRRRERVVVNPDRDPGGFWFFPCEPAG